MTVCARSARWQMASPEPRSSTSGMCSSTSLSSEREHQGTQLHSARSFGSQGSQQRQQVEETLPSPSILSQSVWSTSQAQTRAQTPARVPIPSSPSPPPQSSPDPSVHLSTERIVSGSCSDRSGTTTSERLSAKHQTRTFFILMSHCLHYSTLDSRLSSIASLSTTGARYLLTNHTPSRLHSPPPFLFLLLTHSFPSYFGKRRSTLSRSRMALVDSSLVSRFPTSVCAQQTPLTASYLGRQTHLTAAALATAWCRYRS